MGFILAAAGSAVGLGNIWRFPYVTGENGGAAFVMVYLGCVFLIGLPLLWNELAIGRAGARNALDSFTTIRPGTPYVITGVCCLLCCFLVLSYYGVIAGWTLGYAWTSLTRTHTEFSAFAANPLLVIPLFGVFILLTILIVHGGVQKGIERWSRLLMPLLLVMALLVIARSLTLPGAMAGVEYYLKPDFSKINGKVVVMALGQALFSLSVGWGLMITYGSYMTRQQSIVSSGIWVVLADTFIALLGGFMVFPAVFAFGMAPDGGTALTFKTLPAVFEQMPAGNLVGAVFFLLLMVAALTSSISMLEVPVAWLLDNKKASRNVASWTVGLLAFAVGIPSALSAGGSRFLTEMQFIGKTGFLDIMDMIVGTLLIVLIALLCSLFSGYAWGPRRAIEEIAHGSPGFTRRGPLGLSVAGVWTFFIRFVCPLVCGLILANLVAQMFGKDLF